jgi:hypothetical protein
MRGSGQVRLKKPQRGGALGFSVTADSRREFAFSGNVCVPIQAYLALSLEIQFRKLR